MIKSEWNEKSLKLTSKTAHSKDLISISIRDKNTFFTSSEDRTVRMWDLRTHSSIKLIKNKYLLQQQLSNCQSDKQQILYVGSGKNIFSFDVRQQKVFIEDIHSQTLQQHYDDISFIKYCQFLKSLGAADDEGDIRLYNQGLKATGFMDQKHTNICNSFDFMKSEKSKFVSCFSGGFDCKLIHWNSQEHNTIKEVDVRQLFQKYKIQYSCTYPFIRHVQVYGSSVFAALQTGHIICWPYNQLKKPKFLLQASLAQVLQCKMAKFKQNILISLAGDETFSFFDYIKRQSGSPTFIQKYKINFSANWIQSCQNCILVCGYSPSLCFYQIKG